MPFEIAANEVCEWLLELIFVGYGVILYNVLTVVINLIFKSSDNISDDSSLWSSCKDFFNDKKFQIKSRAYIAEQLHR